MKPIVIIAAGAASLLAAGVVLAMRKSKEPSWREAMLDRADYHVQNRTLYQWGGGHPGIESWGLDCSGLIIDCASEAGFVFEWNSNSMWQLLPHVAEPEPADVALFGFGNKAVHVMLVEWWFPQENRAACIGAQGGDATTTTPEIAVQQGAHVRRLSDHRLDKRFLGFASLEEIATGKRDGRVMQSISRQEMFG